MAIVAFPSLVPIPHVVWWHRSVFFVAHVTVMTGSLAIFRLAGHRLTRLRKDRAVVAPSANTEPRDKTG